MPETQTSANLIPRWAIIAFLVFASIGFADATYLTAKHYLGTSLPCSITLGCDAVTRSQYATVFGIPVALLGAFYYLTMIILSAATLWFGNEKLMRIASRLTIVGLLASAWFIYLQLFVIHAICIYCVTSAGSSTALFYIGWRVRELFKAS